MARGAAQARRKAAKTQNRTRRPSPARRPATVESTMFFPRLRRQAKWVFVFLAFVFAAGFVFFGVGSGSTGLGDLLRGNFNIFGSSGTKVSSGVKNALKETKARPNDPNAWNDLATAYQTDGKLSDANTALEHVLKLRPNDVNALQRVAGYWENQATTKEAEGRTVLAQAPLTLGNVIGVATSTQIGQMLGNDQFSVQVQQKAQTAFSASQSALQKDTHLYKRLAKLQPSDVNTQFHYAQLADITGDAKDAVAAYRRVIRLAPSDPSAKQAKSRIKVLSATLKPVKHG
jgi:tetratricopeptide (TPR) repeat protein